MTVARSSRSCGHAATIQYYQAQRTLKGTQRRYNTIRLKERSKAQRMLLMIMMTMTVARSSRQRHCELQQQCAVSPIKNDNDDDNERHDDTSRGAVEEAADTSKRFNTSKPQAFLDGTGHSMVVSRGRRGPPCGLSPRALARVRLVSVRRGESRPVARDQSRRDWPVARGRLRPSRDRAVSRRVRLPAPGACYIL